MCDSLYDHKRRFVFGLNFRRVGLLDEVDHEQISQGEDRQTQHDVGDDPVCEI